MMSKAENRNSLWAGGWLIAPAMGGAAAASAGVIGGLRLRTKTNDH